eukprot:scaffold80848_cov30-Tisochrysis_lutea.AAC.13
MRLRASDHAWPRRPLSGRAVCFGWIRVGSSSRNTMRLFAQVDERRAALGSTLAQRGEGRGEPAEPPTQPSRPPAALLALLDHLNDITHTER